MFTNYNDNKNKFSKGKYAIKKSRGNNNCYSRNSSELNGEGDRF